MHADTGEQTKPSLDPREVFQQWEGRNVNKSYVQPSPLAFQMTLPTFATERRACYRSISPTRGALSSEPAAAAVNRWDIRLNARR